MSTDTKTKIILHNHLYSKKGLTPCSHSPLYYIIEANERKIKISNDDIVVLGRIIGNSTFYTTKKYFEKYFIEYPKSAENLLFKYLRKIEKRKQEHFIARNLMHENYIKDLNNLRKLSRRPYHKDIIDYIKFIIKDYERHTNLCTVKDWMIRKINPAIAAKHLLEENTFICGDTFLILKIETAEQIILDPWSQDLPPDATMFEGNIVSDKYFYKNINPAGIIGLRKEKIKQLGLEDKFKKMIEAHKKIAKRGTNGVQAKKKGLVQATKETVPSCTNLWE